jgi:hypothetical protein
MFTEEMARVIGIAYFFHCNNCANSGDAKMEIEDFIRKCTDYIEFVREIKGLKNDDVTG